MLNYNPTAVMWIDTDNVRYGYSFPARAQLSLEAALRFWVSQRKDSFLLPMWVFFSCDKERSLWATSDSLGITRDQIHKLWQQDKTN